MSDNNTPYVNEEEMMERGRFTANGYTFTVRPVYLAEEDEYLDDMLVLPVPPEKENGEEYTEKELGRFAITLFSKRTSKAFDKQDKEIGIVERIKRFFARLFGAKDYRYYSEATAIQPVVKWLERKVTYKGRKVRFYDLERKYGLNKAEIERLLMYFHEISGF